MTYYGKRWSYFRANWDYTWCWWNWIWIYQYDRSTNNLTQTKVVGVWEELTNNQDYSPYNQPGYWLFEYTQIKMNNTDYISVSNSNTRIALVKSGWYRIHLSTELINLDSGLHYYVRLLKDHITDEVFYHFDTMTSVPPAKFIDASLFVYSDGTNYIEIRGTVANPGVNGFGIGGSANNHFSIEFVST